MFEADDERIQIDHNCVIRHVQSQLPTQDKVRASGAAVTLHTQDKRACTTQITAGAEVQTDVGAQTYGGADTRVTCRISSAAIETRQSASVAGRALPVRSGRTGAARARAVHCAAIATRQSAAAGSGHLTIRADEARRAAANTATGRSGQRARARAGVAVEAGAQIGLTARTGVAGRTGARRVAGTARAAVGAGCKRAAVDSDRCAVSEHRRIGLRTHPHSVKPVHAPFPTRL